MNVDKHRERLTEIRNKLQEAELDEHAEDENAKLASILRILDSIESVCDEHLLMQKKELGELRSFGVFQ